MPSDIIAGADTICKTMSTGLPFFIGRHGTIEIEVLDAWRAGRSYTLRELELIQNNAGVFPATDDSIDAWCKRYIELLPLLDGGAAGWFPPTAAAEKRILDAHAYNAFRTPLRSLEPYYVESSHQWTHQLAGKKVAVVSSFVETMVQQLTKPIWRGAQKGLLDLPGTEWSFVRTGYAPSTALGQAGWPEGCNTWQKAVDYVVETVVASKAQVALIGCGGLGMIIAGELKRRGVSAIVLGGAIQVLFGIKGSRWATHDIISKFWNESWVWPSVSEIPAGASRIERGCYWGP